MSGDADLSTQAGTGQAEHFGKTGVQICLPKGTSKRLISIQNFFGNVSSRSNMVCSQGSRTQCLTPGERILGLSWKERKMASSQGSFPS